MISSPFLAPNFKPQADTESAQQEQTMTQADFYHLLKHQIENEDNLVNQRLIWLVFSQSFMFSAFAVLLNAPEKPKSPMFGDLQEVMVWLIPCLAIVCSLLIYIGILTSMVMMSELRHRYDKFPEDKTTQHFPPLQANMMMRSLASLGPNFVPLFFIGTWLFILVRQFLFNVANGG